MVSVLTRALPLIPIPTLHLAFKERSKIGGTCLPIYQNKYYVESQGCGLGPNHSPPKQRIHAVVSLSSLFLQMAEIQGPKKRKKSNASIAF